MVNPKLPILAGAALKRGSQAILPDVISSVGVQSGKPQISEFGGVLAAQTAKSCHAARLRSDPVRGDVLDGGIVGLSVAGASSSLPAADKAPVAPVDDQMPGDELQPGWSPREVGPERKPGRPDLNAAEKPNSNLKRVTVRGSAVWLPPTLSARVSERAHPSDRASEKAVSLERMRDPHAGHDDEPSAQPWPGDTGKHTQLQSLARPAPADAPTIGSGVISHSGLEADGVGSIASGFESAEALPGQENVSAPRPIPPQAVPMTVVKSLDIAFEPEDLGRIDIRMKLNVGVLEIHMRATDAQTDSLLRSERDNLVEVLANSGYAVDQMDIGSPGADAVAPDWEVEPIGAKRDERDRMDIMHDEAPVAARRRILRV